jgi:protein-tyrosine kinase
VKQNPSEKVVDAPTLHLGAVIPSIPNSEPNGLPLSPEVHRMSSPLPIASFKPTNVPSLVKRDAATTHTFQDRYSQLAFSIFFEENTSVRSLGFTSAINGEGKSFLATALARILANDSGSAVTLLECNWENPGVHKYYGLPATPGVAEWLRRECREEDVRYRIDQNLTVIPAGDGRKDAVRLLQHMRAQGILKLFAPNNGLLIVDLPPVVTTAYGRVAASLLDAVIVVVRAGVTPNTLVEEACTMLKDLPVHGVVLNQISSKIPRWLRRIM